ncbi:unnamed protein product [Chrysoparadoxa australica]
MGEKGGWEGEGAMGPSAKPPAAMGQSNKGKKAKIRWKRGEVIGNGVSGTVYKALNLDTGEIMAVKQVEVSALDTRDMEAFENEVTMLREHDHPNIVKYFGTERAPDGLSILLEYVAGGSMRSMLDTFGPFEEQVSCIYTQQLLLGLQCLHRKGFAHRDIKAANALVSKDGCVKLADFGLSKRVQGMAGASANSSLTSANNPNVSVKGTPFWIAPEVMQEKNLNEGWQKADIWSLGCTVVEMLTGKPPWAEVGPIAALFKISCTEEEPQLPPKLSSQLQDFLKKCLTRDPSLRPNANALMRHPWIQQGAPVFGYAGGLRRRRRGSASGLPRTMSGNRFSARGALAGEAEPRVEHVYERQHTMGEAEFLQAMAQAAEEQEQSRRSAWERSGSMIPTAQMLQEGEGSSHRRRRRAARGINLQLGSSQSSIDQGSDDVTDLSTEGLNSSLVPQMRLPQHRQSWREVNSSVEGDVDDDISAMSLLVSSPKMRESTRELRQGTTGQLSTHKQNKQMRRPGSQGATSGVGHRPEPTRRPASLRVQCLEDSCGSSGPGRGCQVMPNALSYAGSSGGSHSIASLESEGDAGCGVAEVDRPKLLQTAQASSEPRGFGQGLRTLSAQRLLRTSHSKSKLRNLLHWVGKSKKGSFRRTAPGHGSMPDEPEPQEAGSTQEGDADGWKDRVFNIASDSGDSR